LIDSSQRLPVDGSRTDSRVSFAGLAVEQPVVVGRAVQDLAVDLLDDVAGLDLQGGLVQRAAGQDLGDLEPGPAKS